MRLPPSFRLGAVLAILAVLSFGPVLTAWFVNFDDPAYVLDNPHVHSGFSPESLLWALTTEANGNWHPLTWMSHMLDWRLFGADARGHHAAALLLHAANAVLLFLLLVRLTGAPRRSWVAAALFAIHPLHVESVAWISERKDVLSTLLGLAAMHAYARHAIRPSGRRMALVAVLMAASLAAKPMLVTLPLLLLVLDAWPLGRWSYTHPDWSDVRPLLVEKLPLLVLSIASSAVTLHAQHAAHATALNARVPLLGRLANAATSYVAYLVLTVAPSHLAVFYPFPGGAPWALAAGAVAVLAAISWVALAARARFPFLLTGWLWYAIALVPVIGIVQVGAQARADRYTYLPLVGIFVAASWGCARLVEAWRGRASEPGAPPVDSWVSVAPLLLALPVLATATWFQCHVWNDSISLWRRAIAVTTPVAANHAMLGNALVDAGRIEEAGAAYRDALAIDPSEADALNGEAALLVRRGRPDEALPLLDRAIAARPGFASAHLNRAAALDALGRSADALPEALRAVALDPDSADARRNAGVLLTRAGRHEEAVAELSEARRLAPSRADVRDDLGTALDNWGGALLGAGRIEDGGAAIRRAIALRPDDAKAHSNLAAYFYLARRDAEAWREVHAARALRFEPPRQLVDALRARTPEP